MKINILGMQLTSLGCRDGNGRERGIGGGQGKAARSVVPLCRAAAHPKNNFPVPTSRRRQAPPTATLILSRKSPSFILLKPELSPSSGKQQESE